MAVSNSVEKLVPTSRPVITTYLSSEFYKAAFQWLAEKDERSMAWLAAKWIEAQIDAAVSEGQIPAEVLAKLRDETKDT